MVVTSTTARIYMKTGLHCRTRPSTLLSPPTTTEARWTMALPSEMIAVGISRTGNSFDVIEEFKFPVPAPDPNQVLIKVSYSQLR